MCLNSFDKRNNKIGCIPSKKAPSVVEKSSLSTGLVLQKDKRTRQKYGYLIK